MKSKPAAALLAASVLTGGLLFGLSQQVPPYTSEECKPGSLGTTPYPYCDTTWRRAHIERPVWLPMVVKK